VLPIYRTFHTGLCYTTQNDILKQEALTPRILNTLAPTLKQAHLIGTKKFWYSRHVELHSILHKYTIHSLALI